MRLSRKSGSGFTAEFVRPWEREDDTDCFAAKITGTFKGRVLLVRNHGCRLKMKREIKELQETIDIVLRRKK